MTTLTNSCIGLIHTLTSHVEGLTKLLAGLSNDDRANEVLSRSSLIESLTALAEMFDLMSRISPEPLATDHRRQCIATLIRATGVVSGLVHDDFHIIEMFHAVRFHKQGQNPSLVDQELTPHSGLAQTVVDFAGLHDRSIVPDAH